VNAVNANAPNMDAIDDICHLNFATDTYLVDLRPNDFDRTGHLDESVHPQLIELGRWRWAHANGIDLRGDELLPVVVSLHLDYLRPIAWDPLGCVVVRTDLVKTTAYSFTLAQSVESPDGTVFTRGWVRLTLVDRATREIHRIDLDQWRSDGRVP
jgi:acyl-CoA thioester hydrolase